VLLCVIRLCSYEFGRLVLGFVVFSLAVLFPFSVCRFLVFIASGWLLRVC